MNNVLEYKGYYAKIEYSAEDKVLYGKIEAINDLVTFEAESVKEIEKEFHESVDEYIAFCLESGKVPDKSYSGTFNIRISSELHRQLAIQAIKNDESLNATVEKAISSYIYNSTQKKVDDIWNAVISNNRYDKQTVFISADVFDRSNYNNKGVNAYA